MTKFAPLATYSRDDVLRSMASGQLEMSLGPFSTRIKGKAPDLVEFLFDTYRDVPVRLRLQDVTDVSIDVRPPSLLRKYIKKQVIPDPGFQVPAVPLPSHMASLAFEMGVNLVVALKCCRFVTFHAGVVANDKGAILMCANSGGGKSTLTSALMEEGYRLFSDEFALLSLSVDKGLVPYPRPISLKNESIDVVQGMVGKDWISSVLTDTPKGRIAYRRVRPSDIKAAEQAANAKLILFPRFQEGSKPTARQLGKSEAMMRLIPSSTNYHLLGEKAFHALSEMVSGADAYDIVYGSTEDSLKIVNDLASKVGL